MKNLVLKKIGTVVMTRVISAIVLVFASLLCSHATVVYDAAGFESPRFNAGMNLEGQDPIVPPAGYGPWHKDTGTSTAVVQTDVPNGGLQSVKVTRTAGAAGDTRWGIPVSITPTAASNVVTIDFDLNAIINVGTNWGGPDLGPLFGVECYDASSGTPKLIGSLFLDAYTGNIIYQEAGDGNLQNSSTFIPRNQYHHYALAANFTTKTYSLFVDGNLVHTEGFVDSSAAAFTDAPITVLAATTNYLDQAVGTAYFDNYTISLSLSRLDYLVWRGDGVSNVWDSGTSSNWFNGDRTDVFSNSVPVVFDDTGSNAPSIDVEGVLQPTVITINASQSYTFAGAGSLAGSGRLVKRGTGTLTLAGNNSFIGGVAVSNGTLMVDNVAGSGTGSGAVYVHTGATLGGNGTIDGSVTVANATLAPGDTVGTLTINSNLTFVGDTTLQVELGTASDHLVVGGNVTLNGALKIGDAGGLTAGTYNLISYSGSLSGSILIASGPAGFNCALDTSTPGQVNLVVTVPPPVPDAPSGLIATAASRSEIDLTWTDNSTNETEFLIERSVNRPVFVQIATVSSNVTSFADMNLPSGSTFYYRVRAANSGGNSYCSGVAAATTLGVTAPGTLRAQAGDGEVSLVWSASLGATSYNLKRSLTNAEPYTVIASLTGTNYTDTDVTNGTTYYYAVSAVNAYGESTDAGPVSALPDKELQLQLKFDETGGTNAMDSSGHGRDATLSGGTTWVSGIISNALDLGGNNGYAILPVGAFTNLTAFTISTWVKLDAISMWSRVFDFGSGAGTNMFLTPLSGDGAVRYAITIGGNTKEQRINGQAPLPAGKWTHVAVTLTGTTGILYINGVPVGTNTAMVLNPSMLGATTQTWIGRSQYSDPYLNGRLDEFRIYNYALAPIEIYSLFTNVPPPVPPTGLTGAAGNANVGLKWNASSSAFTYNLKRSTTSGGPYTLVATNLSGTNYLDTTVVNNTTYYYVVSAVNPGGQGFDSAEINVTPTLGRAVARYPFDGNANDTSGNGYNGTATSVSYGPGKIGAQAAQFDGATALVQIPAMIGTNFTVAMWIKTTNAGAAGSAWYAGKGLLDGEASSRAISVTGAQNDWGAALVGSNFVFGVGNPDMTIASMASVVDGAWHHVAASRDGSSGAVRIYVDGALDTAGTAPTGARNAASTLTVGALQNNSMSGFFGGTIDEVRIYDRVLQDGEIIALAGRGAHIGDFHMNSTNAVLTGSGGTPDGTYYVLSSTNIALPIGQWTREATNQFDDYGNGRFTDPVKPEIGSKFYQLQLP